MWGHSFVSMVEAKNEKERDSIDRWKGSAIGASGVIFCLGKKEFAISPTCCGNVPVCGVRPDLVLLKLVASLWWTAALDSLDCDHWPLVQLLLVVMRPILFGNVRKTKLNCLLSLNQHLTSSIPTRCGHGIKKLGLPSKDLFLALKKLHLYCLSTTWTFLLSAELLRRFFLPGFLRLSCAGSSVGNRGWHRTLSRTC